MCRTTSRSRGSARPGRLERGETQSLPWLRPKLAKALRVSADRLEELLATDGAPASPQGRTAAVPKQPPAAIADFTGRAAELEALTRMLTRPGPTRRARR